MGEPKSSPIFPLRLCNAVNVQLIAEYLADIRDLSLYDQSVSDGALRIMSNCSSDLI